LSSSFTAYAAAVFPAVGQFPRRIRDRSVDQIGVFDRRGLDRRVWAIVTFSMAGFSIAGRTIDALAAETLGIDVFSMLDSRSPDSRCAGPTRRC
jgi:hypothetical protein